MILRLTIANQKHIGTGEPRHTSLTSYTKEDGNGHDYQMEKLKINLNNMRKVIIDMLGANKCN